MIKKDDLPDGATISQRAQDVIRGRYSQSQEFKILRLALVNPLDEVAKGGLVEYHEFIESVRAAASDARTYVANENEATAIEQAKERLLKPVSTEPQMIDSTDLSDAQISIQNPVVVKDVEERAAAQSLIDSASQEALSIVAQREAEKAEAARIAAEEEAEKRAAEKLLIDQQAQFPV